MHYNLQLVDKLIDQIDSATNNDNDDGGGNIAELIGHYTTNRQQEKDITLTTTIRTPSYLSPLPPFTSPVTTVIELLNINVPNVFMFRIRVVPTYEKTSWPSSFIPGITCIM